MTSIRGSADRDCSRATKRSRPSISLSGSCRMIACAVPELRPDPANIYDCAVLSEPDHASCGPNVASRDRRRGPDRAPGHPQRSTVAALACRVDGAEGAPH